MKLTKVTITGADDKTDIQQLVDLSFRFSFVEWGILVSKAKTGSRRFPSEDWINAFTVEAAKNNLNVATHICGRWTRELIAGTLKWYDLPSCIDVCQRIQINTHADARTAILTRPLAMAEKLLEREKIYIFQLDGVNNSLPLCFPDPRIKKAGLFDLSGGAGVLPNQWLSPNDAFPCGYAGGLGPENILEQLTKIDAVCPPDYETWVDMERRVRTDDDEELDLARVTSVLEQVAGLIQ